MRPRPVFDGDGIAGMSRPGGNRGFLEVVMDEAGSLEKWSVAGEGGPADRSRRSSHLRDVPNIGFETMEEQQRAEESFVSLSSREVTVLAYLAYGLSAKEVAITLNVSSRTVDTFRTRALLKLRARNTADAVRILTMLSARVWLGDR